MFLLNGKPNNKNKPFLFGGGGGGDGYCSNINIYVW